jgi:hypothetical protein
VRGIARTIINCTDRLKTVDSVARARLLDGERVWEIDTGHDLMISKPAAVTEMLLKLAEA